MDTIRERIKSVTCLGEVDDYVYDISMAEQDPMFFANDVLVHNTDSVYFSAAPVIPEGHSLTLDGAAALYDHMSQTVSDTFPQLLKDEFNVDLKAGAVMKAGREVVGRAGLFITKKRYAILVMDDEGKRPEGGKLKAMGLDLKRSDTPEFIQDFLQEILVDALRDKTEVEIIDKIKKFKEQFKTLEPWLKGMPKRVNNLSYYEQIYNRSVRMPGKSQTLYKLEKIKEDSKSKTIPGHVRASINWNNLIKMNSDNYSTPITDGAKVIVCRLKNNPMGYKSVAYPVDEMHLPEWFKQLPFDEEDMEHAVLDKKIENLFGVLKWDLSRTQESPVISNFFDFD